MNTEGDSLICSYGCNLTKVSRYCISNGIAGYEGFIGIPGTIGAAAINNSGAFSSEMSKVVKYLEVLNSENQIKRLNPEESNYKTRSSILKDGSLKAFVLRVALDISQKEEISVLESKAEEIKKLRQNTIDGKRKSLGSVFVSTSLRSIFDQHKLQALIKRICFAPFKIIFTNQKLQQINTFLDFLFLGIPKFAKHCDSLNRFCWEKETTENDFLDYINSMQKLANNQLKLEIDIKGISK
jgi:UDP-N-acetylmuramate dehydrogenase